ncbi:MAG: aspartyl-phosphate phosphatase Spo0E family protein [Desulfitobacteriaceae bacterium]
MREIKEILKQIEELRKSLVKLGESRGLTDPEVVTASQALDAVLNEYYKLLRERVDKN